MAQPPSALAQRLVVRLERYQTRLSRFDCGVKVHGTLIRTVGLVMEARGLHVAIGERCFVETESGRLLPAEVVGFDGGRVLLMAEGHADGLTPGARVMPAGRTMEAAVGPELLGRVIDGGGAPLDGKGQIRCAERVPLFGPVLNPMRRALVDEPLDVGVRSINALFTVGRGSRLGLFAGSGVGKSVLLGMMARYTSADVVVVGLIGERSREVKEFVARILGAEGLAKAVVVAAPADQSALGRVHGAYRATAIAEYFRDCGYRVLLLMDSLTRFAMAQREIGLAVGEIPASRGYPPSVFGRISSLCERAGTGLEGSGSITALYTVLVEGDDPSDPVADAARSILDGHLVLSRALADRGHFPALDVAASVSRVMPAVVPVDQVQASHRFKQLCSRLEESRDLIAIGGYRPGHDAELDRAVSLQPAINELLRQDMNKAVRFPESVGALRDIVG
ncbi:MAG: FliI/YscN family ATPase [Alphaproteobacteria bacterium]|nr:FliI/YscN family ATPase [Alphaproteobacteria bacterium]MBV9552025.1 FliI/YscN family ATPase [Alphaproteobacteria bacterium]